MAGQLLHYSPRGPVNGRPVDGDLVEGSEVGTVTLTDYDVLPRVLEPSLAGVDRAVISDPLSFPFEDAGPSLWNVPLLVLLPDLSFDELVALFDQTLFRQLTVFDRLAAPDPLVDPLRKRYGFGRSMFVPPDQEAGGPVVANEPPSTIVHGKRCVVRLDRLVREAVAGASVQTGRNPATELHGWNVHRFIPSAWVDLARVVERAPEAFDQLRFEYPEPHFEIARSSSSVRPLASDVGVGIDHLRLAGVEAYEQSLSALFGSVQVGGRLVLFETFDGDVRPDDFVDLLLDISTHRLVLVDLRILASDGDEPSSTALFVLNKIGTWVSA